MSDHESRISELEMRFTYQDQLIQDLSDVLITQQQQLDQQNVELKRLQALLDSSTQNICRPEDEVPPPHY